jgi:hypothetical protein
MEKLDAKFDGTIRIEKRQSKDTASNENHGANR